MVVESVLVVVVVVVVVVPSQVALPSIITGYVPDLRVAVILLTVTALTLISAFSSLLVISQVISKSPASSLLTVGPVHLHKYKLE